MRPYLEENHHKKVDSGNELEKQAPWLHKEFTIASLKSEFYNFV
jgi:hypothetical protein